MATARNLADIVTGELAGKSLQWWRGKLHDYMERASTAEKDLVTMTEERDAARIRVTELEATGVTLTTERDAARQQVTELDAHVVALTTERDQVRTHITELEGIITGLEAANATLTTERDAVQAEAQRLQAEVDSLDLNTIFDRMTKPWEAEIENLRKKFWP